MLRIDFLRHGALQGGIKYRGISEESLTTQGLDAMNQVWKKLQNEVSLIVSSPLSRCAEPAQTWATQSGTPIVIDDRLTELHYGEWEGLTVEEIEVKFPDMLESWRRDPTFMQPPSGEPMQFFAKRITSFWQNLLNTYNNEHILIVGHSGSIRMLLANALSAPIVSTRHLAMPYACWSRVELLENGEGSKGERASTVQLVFHAR